MGKKDKDKKKEGICKEGCWACEAWVEGGKQGPPPMAGPRDHMPKQTCSDISAVGHSLVPQQAKGIALAHGDQMQQAVDLAHVNFRNFTPCLGAECMAWREVEPGIWDCRKLHVATIEEAQAAAADLLNRAQQNYTKNTEE